MLVRVRRALVNRVESVYHFFVGLQAHVRVFQGLGSSRFSVLGRVTRALIVILDVSRFRVQ